MQKQSFQHNSREICQHVMANVHKNLRFNIKYSGILFCFVWELFYILKHRNGPSLYLNFENSISQTYLLSGEYFFGAHMSVSMYNKFGLFTWKYIIYIYPGFNCFWFSNFELEKSIMDPLIISLKWKEEKNILLLNYLFSKI